MSTKTEQAIIEVIIKGQQPNATLKEMEASARALRSQMGRLKPGSDEFVKATEKFREVTGRINAIKREIHNTGQAFGALSMQSKSFIGSLIAGFTGGALISRAISGIMGSIRTWITGNSELSDSLADIRKTTGMTQTEVENLDAALQAMDTRTPTSELRKVAIAAGQLGIAKGDVLKFVGAVDKMVVSLGDEFKGGAEEVTKVMGGLRMIFKDIQSDKIDQDMLKIGNAVNVLASEGAATGPITTDFANRIGGVATNMGWASGQVLGLSATLEELRVGTEKGGTATVKILQHMTTNVEGFAAVAGIGVKEFTDLVNNDMFGAFMKVVEGANKGGSSATALGKILKDLDVDGAGASEVMSKLGSNTELLRKKVDTANQALKGTDSIMAEFTLKNRTLAAEMDRLGKGITDRFTNSAASDALRGIIGTLADMVSMSKAASVSMEEERNHANALAMELLSSNTTMKRRNEIYDELKSIAPEIIAGIDKESMSMEKLARNIDKYNELQIKRIAIQKQQEKVDEANEAAANRLIEHTDILGQAYEALGKIRGDVGLRAKKILDDENLSLQQKLEKLEAMTTEEMKRGNNAKKDFQQQREFTLLTNGLVHLRKRLADSEAEYAEAVKVSTGLTAKKAQMESQLGVTEKERLDYSKLSLEELNDLIEQNRLSHGSMAREAAAAMEELAKRRVKDATEQLGLIEKLQSEIQALTESRVKATTVIQIQGLNAQIKNKQEQLDVLLGKENEHLKKIKALHEKLQEDLKKIANDNEMAKLDEYQQARKVIQDEYDSLFKRIAEDERLKLQANEAEKTKALEVITEQRNRKLLDLNLKHFNEIGAAAKALQEEGRRLMQSDIENEKQAIRDKYDNYIIARKAKDSALKISAEEEKAINEKKNREIEEVDKRYKDKLLSEERDLDDEIFRATHSEYEIRIREAMLYYNELIELAKKAGKDTVELEKAKGKELAEIDNEELKRRIQKFADTVDPYVEQFQNFMAIDQQIRRNKAEAQNQADEQKYQKDLAREKRLLDSKIISQEDYDRKVQQIESANESRKRTAALKQFAAEKEAARSAVLIDLAQATMKTFAQYGFSPMAWGLVTTGGIVALKQLEEINSRPAPSFAAGGLHDPGGFVERETMFNSSSGVPFIAGEKGAEWIAPNWMLQNPFTASAIGMLEQVREKRSFASGGSTAAPAAPQSNQISISGLAEFAQALNRLNNHLDAGIGVNYDRFTKEMASIESARNSGRIN